MANFCFFVLTIVFNTAQHLIKEKIIRLCFVKRDLRFENSILSSVLKDQMLVASYNHVLSRTWSATNMIREVVPL